MNKNRITVWNDKNRIIEDSSYGNKISWEEWCEENLKENKKWVRRWHPTKKGVCALFKKSS